MLNVPMLSGTVNNCPYCNTYLYTIYRINIAKYSQLLYLYTLSIYTYIYIYIYIYIYVNT